MSVGSEAYIVICIEFEGVDVAFRGVGDTVHGEPFRNFAHVGVQDAVKALGPDGGELAVGVLHHCVYIALEDGVELSLDGEVVAVLEAGVGLLVHQAVVACNLEHVAEVTAGGEVHLAVEADIFDGAVVIGLPYHVHFREVREQGGVLDILVLYGFRLQEGQGGEAPAGAAPVLVLDRSNGVFLNCGKFIVLRAHGGAGLCNCRIAGKHCSKDADSL